MGFKVMGWDASGPLVTVGYIDDGVRVGEISIHGARLAGSHLVEWIGEQAQIFGKPDGLAVGIGPGSFTGVRIALTAAKAMGFGWGIPVKGVSSLAAWASSVGGGQRVVVTSERRGPAFYLGYYWAKEGGVQPFMKDVAVSGELPAPFPVPHDVVVVGPASEDPHLLASIGPRARACRRDLSGVEVARLGWPTLQWGKADDLVGLAPAYLRPPAITQPNEVNHGTP